MITWSEFRTQLRNTVLKDVDEVNWEDEQIAFFAAMAFDQLCQHTAAVTGVTITGFTGTTAPVPENVYETLDETGLIYLKNRAGNIVTVSSAPYPFEDTTSLRFATRGQTLLFSRAPDSGYDELHIDYYAYYNHPVQDSDVVDVPQWAHSALIYRIAAFAMVGPSVTSTLINQWKGKKDSGTPEHNALLAAEADYVKRWERELARVRQQIRKRA